MQKLIILKELFTEKEIESKLKFSKQLECAFNIVGEILTS
jgi:hypothetical protein